MAGMLNENLQFPIGTVFDRRSLKPLFCKYAGNLQDNAHAEV